MNTPQEHTLHILKANPAWKLIMQSGVIIKCTVGIYLNLMLQQELGLSEEQIAPVDAIILNGMPVDEPEKTVVPCFARLALASGLPGIAGLAMKKGSAVRGLRSGITHTQTINEAPVPGEITLSLYSLTMPQLAGHFLERGVWVNTEQLKRYCQFAPEEQVLFNEKPIQGKDLEQHLLKLPATALIKLTAQVMS